MRLLTGALADVHTTARLDLPQWNRLLLCARYHGLLARLCVDLLDQGLFSAVPADARRQLTGARIAAEANQATIRFEIGRVRAALRGERIPAVLLKGGAYLAAGLPAARGRQSVDLDILVPKADLGRAERALLARGWKAKELNAYDDLYYRQWMHELPPLRHPERETELDVHHTIFPPISGIVIGGDELLAAATPLPDGLAILQPSDLVLHCALHLFAEDPSNRLRDLLDLRDLIRHFEERDAEFWPALLRRSRQLQVAWVLPHAVRQLGMVFGMPAPAAVGAAIARSGRLGSALLDKPMAAAILGRPHGESGPWTALAQGLLYMRSHWLKMPLPLLARHLWTKARRRAGDGGAGDPLRP